MAITSLDGVLAGAQPSRFIVKASTAAGQIAARPHSWWGQAGAPGPGAYDATLNGANLVGNAVAGQIPRTNPSSGNAYLARLTIAPNFLGVAVLCDRLWSNQLAVNNTTLQSITQPTLPARDAAGSTNGDGVLIALETSVAASATAVAATLTYTNQAGTGSRTATLLDATAASATIAGSFFRFALQAGDTGVRSVQSVQFSTAWTTGTINLVAYRVIAQLEMALANVAYALDALSGGLPRVYDNSVLFFFTISNAITALNLAGSYTETQG